MPLPIDEKKKGAILLKIRKKLSGSSDYDSMKEEVMKPKKVEDGAEVEYNQNGYDVAAEELISSIKSGDAGALKSALKSFITLCMLEEEKED
jgi:hypothetical protein